MLKKLWKPTLRVAVVLAAVAGVAFAGGERERSVSVLFTGEDGSRHEVVLDDLDGLAPGETRELWSEDGEPVTITREGDGFRIEAAGRSIELLGHEERLGREIGEEVRRRVEIRSEHGPKVWISGDGELERDLTVVHGLGGAHAFAFSGGEGLVELEGLPLLHSVDRLLERLEENEKFAGLDDLTQELVREAIRESAPKPRPLLWQGLEGDDGTVKVIVRDKVIEESVKE